jgi:hypothetical protein
MAVAPMAACSVRSAPLQTRRVLALQVQLPTLVRGRRQSPGRPPLVHGLEVCQLDLRVELGRPHGNVRRHGSSHGHFLQYNVRTYYLVHQPRPLLVRRVSPVPGLPFCGLRVCNHAGHARQCLRLIAVLDSEDNHRDPALKVSGVRNFAEATLKGPDRACGGLVHFAISQAGPGQEILVETLPHSTAGPGGPRGLVRRSGRPTSVTVAAGPSRLGRWASHRALRRVTCTGHPAPEGRLTQHWMAKTRTAT